MSSTAPTEQTPTEHTFIVEFAIASLTDPDPIAVRFYDDEALQDASISGPDDYGRFEAEFDREDATFARAALSALRDLRRVLPEAEILRFAHEDLVSLAAIARRLGKTHECVRLYARNKRGPGTFPPTAGRLDAKTEVWRWSEIAAWWQETHEEPIAGIEEDLVLTLLNDALEMRRIAAQIDQVDETKQLIADIFPSGEGASREVVSA